MPANHLSPADSNSGARLRSDLAVVELDGDLVVYDPVEPACHVLSGGAVIVWAELDGNGSEGLVERICRRVGADLEQIGDEIRGVLTDFARLGLLEPVVGGDDN